MTSVRTRVNPRTRETEHKGYCDVCKRNVHKVWMPNHHLDLVNGDIAQHDRMFHNDGN